MSNSSCNVSESGGVYLMKKLFASMVIIVLLFISFTAAVFAETPEKAAEKIIEVPDIRIIIDGKLTTYTNTPININGKNLLPLRELLVNLGVQNDDEHIIYNHDDKSVTIKKDDTTIFLAVGNKTAYVNGSPTELDVAPVFYVKNNDGKVYIPLAFVSEALGKKVVWNGISRAVLICDETKYNNIKEILDKSEKAEKEISRYKAVLDFDCTSSSGMVKVNFTGSVHQSVDIKQKMIFLETNLDMLGVNSKTISYYADNASYMQNPVTQEWLKKTYIPAEYDALFQEQKSSLAMEFNEVLYTGLNLVQGENSEEIVLKGDIVLTDMLMETMRTQNSGFMPSTDDLNSGESSIEITLDAETYLVKSVTLNIKYTTESEGLLVDTEAVMKTTYSDYNGDFEITVPEDVVKNAIEIEKEEF